MIAPTLIAQRTRDLSHYARRNENFVLVRIHGGNGLEAQGRGKEALRSCGEVLIEAVEMARFIVANRREGAGEDQPRGKYRPMVMATWRELVVVG
jgi:hypothetical protein